MTAIEIAYALVNSPYEPIKAEAVVMLRQQQAEKEALKRQCARYEELIASWNVDAIDKTQERVEESAKNVHELADELDQAVFKLIASDNCTEAQAVEESQGVLRLLQDKLDIESAYNAIHIERIQALRSALNEILENDGSRRIYSAGGLYDAREKAEALLREAGNQDA